MPTEKAAKQKSKAGSRGRKKFAPTQDPIIITGGSVKIEYSDKADDGFDDDGSLGGRKKKIKHKRNSAGRAELTRVEIYHPRNGTAPVQTVDLRSLGINRNCRIEIHYDFE
jgi:hypothetical protein